MTEELNRRASDEADAPPVLCWFGLLGHAPF